MLYSEFIENANVKDDRISWSVYSALNKWYMRYDFVTKEDVYKYGRTMCDELHDVARSDIKETTGEAGEYIKGEKENAEQKERG